MLAQFFIAAAPTTPTLHCSDPAAANYQQIPDGVAAPWLCTYLAYGCGDPLADNFDPDVDVLAASMCMFAGCNDTDATNFDGRATFNDGSCRYERQGCTDPASPSYSPAFTVSCSWWGWRRPRGGARPRRLPVPPADAQRDPRRAADERGEPHPERALEPGIGEVVD